MSRKLPVLALTLCFILSFCSFSAHRAHAQTSQPATPARAPAPTTINEWKRVKLVRSRNPKEMLKNLHWLKDSMEVASAVAGTTFQPKVKLEGQFQREDWTLVRGEQPVNVEKKTGRFSIDVPLIGAVTPVQLYAVGPRGEVEDEKSVLVFPGWTEYVRRLRELLMAKPSVFVGLGISTLSYTQTGLAVFQETGVTLRAAYQGLWKAPWDYGFTGYFTVLPFGANFPGASARFFGFNARAGYAFPWLKDPWRLSLMGGIYYTTMFVSGASFGYKDLAGPMLYPVLRRIISAKDTLSGYFKFSPISNGIGFLALASREIATGLAWSRQEPGSKPFSISLDYANLDLLVKNARSNSHSVSLGFSYGF